ncbi:hypothetical protein Tco_0255107 [Tanacetum coccineum]
MKVKRIDIKKVIKEQVKSEVSKITPQIEKLVNEQLESKVLVRSSKEAKTSHVEAANLSKLELKKILIEKMEANKSISRPQDGADDDQEPSAGTDQGSKRRRSGKEPESTSAPREKNHHDQEKRLQFETGVYDEQLGRRSPFSPDWSQHLELMKRNMQELTELNTFVKKVYKANNRKNWTGSTSNAANNHHDLRNPLPFVQSQGLHVIPYHHFINNDLIPTLCETILCICGRTRESARDVYSKRRIIAVTKSFKEGDVPTDFGSKDIEDMLALAANLLGIGKLQFSDVEERLAFNVTLRIYKGLVSGIKSHNPPELEGIIPRDIPLVIEEVLRYGYIKIHKKTIKNKQARTRESEEYKAEARKSSLSQNQPRKVKVSQRWSN